MTTKNIKLVEDGIPFTLNINGDIQLYIKRCDIGYSIDIIDVSDGVSDGKSISYEDYLEEIAVYDDDLKKSDREDN